jgi:hypothetical protein
LPTARKIGAVAMRVAAALRRAARAEIVRQMRMQQRDAAVVQRDIDRLAAAALRAFGKREQNAGERVQAGDHVDDGQADARGGTVALAVHAHQAGHRLNRGVVAGQAAEWTVGTETRYGAMDQLRETLAQIALVVHAPAPERAGFEVFDQHVGIFQQLPQDRAAFIAREIDRDALLVAVHARKVPRGVAVERRPPTTRFVAVGRLELDHPRAVIGERLRAVRAAEHAAQVDHLDALQRALLAIVRKRCGHYALLCGNSCSACSSVTLRP